MPRKPIRRAPAKPTPTLRILCVHGVGHQEADANFEATWKAAALAGLRSTGLPFKAEFGFVHYDALFAAAPRDLAVWRKGFERLLASGFNAAVERVQHWIGGLLGHRGGPPAPVRGFGDRVGALRDGLQWTAGMVAQWAADDALRAQARARLAEDLERFQPNVVLAHSLGSLIAYDTFGRRDEAGTRAAAGRCLVSFGSQINNPFVRDRFGGRITELPTRHWFHLFNRHDDAFTASIGLPLAGFTQVATPFDLDGVLDHDAAAYLSHPETSHAVWRTLVSRESSALAVDVAAVRAGVGESGEPPAPRSLREAITFNIGSAKRTVARRALLVGINDYPRPEMRLEGCVNDVYLVSRRLQELGFSPENVRIVLNDRATAAAIRDRLEWLLDGCSDEQGRVFYYSGHGAQLPGYGYGETVDRTDECLVPYDFDWSQECAVIDNWFYELYSQLPPRARVLAMFDCCHSGGLSRDGSARVRGITPPDDIRHRILAWDESSRTWQTRTHEGLRAATPAGGAVPSGEVRVRRMFRGARQRAAGLKTSWDEPAPFGHEGPFFPVILEACQEHQLAYEHRDGPTAYGAFTWSLGQVLAQSRRPRSWGDLARRIERQLGLLRYAQAPGLEGPPGVAEQSIPWLSQAGP
jgi:hypothetical protein